MLKRKLITSVLALGVITTSLMSPAFAASKNSTQARSYSAPNSNAYATHTQLPPGVSFDANVNPVAPLTADNQTKTDAVLQVAKSQLGTPYVWGQSKDRGGLGKVGYLKLAPGSYWYNHITAVKRMF